MTELEKLVEATNAPYLNGETLTVENATVAANALKVAMQDRWYSVEQQALYLGGFIEVLMNDPTTRCARDKVIQALGDGFGLDVSVTVSSDGEEFSLELKQHQVH